MKKKAYVTLCIEYDDDERYYDFQAAEMAVDMVVKRANSHNHTIENGITICNIENCGKNN